MATIQANAADAACATRDRSYNPGAGKSTAPALSTGPHDGEPRCEMALPVTPQHATVRSRTV